MRRAWNRIMWGQKLHVLETATPVDPVQALDDAISLAGAEFRARMAELYGKAA